LGSINLSKFVLPDGGTDYEKLSKIARLAVRFLDNCIDVNTYVLKEIEEEELKTRRIGLGIMGFADFLIKKKIIYGSDECIKSISKLMSFFAATVNEESETLGRVKGIPSALVNAGIMRRNGTLTCIAPTGSISLIAGCSSGCEPIFSFDYKKVCVDTELSMITKCKKDPYYISALNVSPRQHVRVLAEFQRYIDAGVSKTVNLPNSTTEKEVGELLLYAYKLGCKSLTVYRQGSRDVEALVETGMEKEETNIEEKKIANKVKRPNIIHGITRRMVLGEGVLYVTINELNGNPFEVFVKIGKSGGRDAAFSEALGRLASLALRSGVPISNVVTTLQNITGDIVTWNNGVKITSIPDALSYILREFYETSDKPIIEKYKKVYEVCPDCSSDTKHEEGCVKCTNDTCGWSQCG
jgi:ribonucleoside-diphosphate reductase alpha chain